VAGDARAALNIDVVGVEVSGTRRIGVASMGGTIVMLQGEDAGLVPTLNAADLVSAVPELRGLVTVVGESVSSVGSPSVRFENVIRALEWGRSAVDDGAAGVVVTHGTDTLEETAFLLDLWWDRSAPLVVTGAMRSPEESGADGPANLLAAVLTVLAEDSRDRGALVVMNDEVFAATAVTKTRSFGVDAFTSPLGALGRVCELQVEYALNLATPRPEPLPVPAGSAWVPIVPTPLGEDERTLDALVAAGADGIVLEGVGAGHVPELTVPAVARAVAKVPVVMASRTRRGRTGRITYGYPGAEIDLLQRGVLMSGRLNATQSRLLLWSLLASGVDDRAQIEAEFTRRGR
jgi:L-asparaginase